MEWIKNLKISQKLLVLISLGALFVFVVGLVGFCFNQKSAADMSTLYKDRLLPVKWWGTMESNLINNRVATYSYITTSSSATKNRDSEEIKTQAAENNELIALYEKTKLDPYEVENLASYKEELTKYRATRARVLQLDAAGNDSAALVLLDATHNQFKNIVAIADGLLDYNAKVAEDINVQSKKDATAATVILIVTILAAAGLLMALGTMISNMIANPIMQAVDSLNESSDNVASASEELSAASQQLAEGSTEQAASIQETSATIEESASMVHQTSDNTKQAAYLAKSAKDAAQRGGSEMNEMMSSMHELQKSSNEISKIIKVIDEIAFQTNILALNAAVEAARAGDAGKGFAVVAEEVRNLAQRCAQAAQDTAVIIESNIHLSAQGVDISGHVNKSLTEINEQAQKVSDLLDEVAVASQEQTQGISQINQAISQMEQVIRSNANTAEQSASASEQLSMQALDMKHLVSSLAVLVHGAEALSHSGGSRPMLSNSQRGTKFIGSNY